MKRFILLMISVLSFPAVSSNVFADAPKDLGPEVINLKMGTMNLPFQHWKHQTSLHKECYNCHKTKIGQIDGWGKEVAHKICIPCHDLENKGPVLCQECHKKRLNSRQ
jgi:hypothetical protein